MGILCRNLKKNRGGRGKILPPYKGRYEIDVKTEWEGIHNSREWGKYPSHEMIRFFCGCKFREKDNSKIKVLDVGCGNGASLWYILREGFDGYGIDISEKAIERTREFLKGERLEAKLEVGDMQSLPYEDNTFGVIIDVCSTQCDPIEDIPKIIQEYKRVLILGGIYFTLWRDKDSWIEPNQCHTTALVKRELFNLIAPYFHIIGMNYSEYSLYSIGDSKDENVYIKHHVLIAQKIN